MQPCMRHACTIYAAHVCCMYAQADQQQLDVALPLYMRVLSLIKAMLLNVQILQSVTAHNVLRKLAGQFDWCLNKAEACRAQLNTPQSINDLGVCAWQSIFDGAMEGGCIGAGHESFGAGGEEYERSIFLLHFLLLQDSVSESDRSVLLFYTNLFFQRLQAVNVQGSAKTRFSETTN